jgi:peptidoglycan/LPS O-acetylase OafA/YrhL
MLSAVTFDCSTRFRQWIDGFVSWFGLYCLKDQAFIWAICTDADEPFPRLRGFMSATLDSLQFSKAEKSHAEHRRADFNKNNLDCLRLILASTVFLFHVNALTNLPAFSFLGKYCSPHFAVRSFFVISGLLIYRSYTRSRSTASYLEKRGRRIYPAYFTIIVLAALTLWPLSVCPLSQYFGMGFWKYLGANLLFLNFLAPSLPGVFTSNALSAVNGALWTLKIEVVFYLSIPLLHYLCGRFGTKRIMGTLFCLSCLWKYGFAWLDYIHRSQGIASLENTRTIYAQLEVQFPGQFAYFAAGILLLLYFDKLKAHFVSISFMTACLFLVDHFFTGEIFDVFWMSGVVFVFGFWRYFGNFSKYGDFSYGVYIVHWPLLQITIALGLARLNPAVFFLICLSLVGLTSVFLWHLVENRFLAGSSHYRQGSSNTPVLP